MEVLPICPIVSVWKELLDELTTSVCTTRGHDFTSQPTEDAFEGSSSLNRG